VEEVMTLFRNASGEVTYYFDTEEAKNAFVEGLNFEKKYYSIEAVCSNVYDGKSVITPCVDTSTPVEFDVVDTDGKVLRHVSMPKKRKRK
jgi:hypothetical protein